MTGPKGGYYKAELGRNLLQILWQRKMLCLKIILCVFLNCGRYMLLFACALLWLGCTPEELWGCSGYLIECFVFMNGGDDHCFALFQCRLVLISVDLFALWPGHSMPIHGSSFLMRIAKILNAFGALEVLQLLCSLFKCDFDNLFLCYRGATQIWPHIQRTRS